MDKLEKTVIILETLEVLYEEGCITNACYNEKLDSIKSSVYNNKHFKLIYEIEKKLLSKWKTI